MNPDEIKQRNYLEGLDEAEVYDMISKGELSLDDFKWWCIIQADLAIETQHL